MRASPSTRSARTPLTAALLLWVAAVVACGGEGAPGDGADGRPPGGDAARGGAASASDTGVERPGADGPAAVQKAAYSVRGSLLVRHTADGDRPLLALDSAAAPAGVPAVPFSWRPAPDAAFRIAATTFRHVVPSPEGRWVAWEAGSTHDLLGVIPADGGPPTVLDFYFDSSAEELTWAPAGRYLLARHLPPSGMEEARVYDVRAGTRLRTPWGETCRARDGCRVSSAEWTGRTTMSVTTSDGRQRRHEVDVSGLPAEASSASGGEATPSRRPPAAVGGRTAGSTRALPPDR